MTNRNQNILFVVSSYAFFWLVLLAGISILFLGNQEIFQKMLPYIRTVGTWTPTFALLIFFKKLCMGITIKEFYKIAFMERINIKLLLVFAILYLLVVVGAASIYAFIQGDSYFNLFQMSFQIIVSTLFWSLVQGATGEESGWRGYLQQSVEKKYSVVKASLIVGVIWAGWHMPTWFVQGLTGRNLILFILSDILIKMSLATIIGICYSRCRNLIIPVVIHFISNFFMLFMYPTQVTNNGTYYLYALLILFLAIGYIVWYNKISTKDITTV